MTKLSDILEITKEYRRAEARYHVLEKHMGIPLNKLEKVIENYRRADQRHNLVKKTIGYVQEQSVKRGQLYQSAGYIYVNGTQVFLNSDELSSVLSRVEVDWKANMKIEEARLKSYGVEVDV